MARSLGVGHALQLSYKIIHHTHNLYFVWFGEKEERKRKNNNNTREVEGFETTLSCYVESYLNKFVPCSELTRNFQTCEKQNREKHMPKKNKHMHKTIFTWFGNLLMSTELQGFYYYQGKIQRAAVPFFSLSKTTSRNPNHQNNGFYILRTGLRYMD